MNTWPGGKRRALSQSDHESWNAGSYPGTRQMCIECNEPTGFCEEDGYYDQEGEPLCQPCAKSRWYCDACGTYIPGEQ